MKDQDLLRALAEVAAEEKPMQTYLEAIARGQSPPAPALSDFESQVAEACGPPSEEQQDKLVAQLVASTSTARPTADAVRKSNVVSLRRVLPAAWALVPLAAAALLVMWLRAPGVPGLPSYDATFSGGVHTSRSTPSAVEGELHLRRGASFEALLRPTTRVEGKVSTRTLLVKGSDVRPVTLRTQMADQGSVRIEGEADLIDAPPGDYDLVIVVGRSESMPADSVAARLAAGASSNGSVFVVRKRLVVEREP